MQAVSFSSAAPLPGAQPGQPPQAASRDSGGFGQVLRGLSEPPSGSAPDSVPSDAALTDTAGPDGVASGAEAEGDLREPDLPPADLQASDTLNAAELPVADPAPAADLLALLVTGAAAAARLPPSAFAILQAAEGAMTLLASAVSQAGSNVASAGPGSISLSGPLAPPPDAANGAPVQTPPQGLSPTAGDGRDPDPLPPSQETGPGLRASAGSPMPARITGPDPGPGTASVPQQMAAVPAVFAFRSTDHARAADHDRSDADAEGPAAAPPAPTGVPGTAVPEPDLVPGAAPPVDLADPLLLPLHPGDADHPLGAPPSLGPAAPVPPLQGAGAAFVPAPLAATLSDLLMRRTDGPVELTLSPEELGRVRLSLSPDGDGLHVTVLVERGDTLDLLRRNSDLLLQEIRAQGFSGATFSFSGWAGDRPEQRAQPGSAATRPVLSPDPAVSAPPASSSPAAGLDLRL